MTDLDFASLWGSEPPKQSAPPQKTNKDSNQYIELKKEYQQYIQYNKEVDAQRKAVNQAMVQMIKDSEQGKHDNLLDDSLKVISTLMRDKAFYIQMTNNLKQKEG